MSAPIIPVQVNLPEAGNQPVTYGDYLDQLNCSCMVGALIMPSPLPSGLFNLGDIISEIAKFLSVFTSIYKVIAKILKIIGCILEIICAIPNPIKLVIAIIKFFTVCFPELLELFPQFAVLLFIICLIKIILSIIIYIVTVLIPLIEDIVANFLLLKKNLEKNNLDGYTAVAFKIISLFSELRSLLAILAILAPIFEMIKALLGMGVPIPCLGGGGDDDPTCPKIIKQPSIDGTDGNLIVLYGEKGPFDFDLIFSSSQNSNNFITLRDFFPSDVNYDEARQEDLPYVLNIVNDNTYYAATRIDNAGNVFVRNIATELNQDGYLSDSYGGPHGTMIKLSDGYARFASASADFTNSIGKYVTLKDTRDGASANSGTWKIYDIYDAYNAKVTLGDPEKEWYNLSSAASVPPFVYWEMAPVAPTRGMVGSYKLLINHIELIRHSMISSSCHPAVEISIQSVANRFPEISSELPPEAVLPDINALIANINGAVDKVIPKDATVQYVIDNYDTIDASTIAPEVIGYLDQFKEDSLIYLGYVMPRVFDSEKTILDANPKLQLIGDPININIIAYDRSGDRMGKGLPPGTVTAVASSDVGDISSTVEVLDSDGNVIGEFAATLTSQIPTKAYITGKVLDLDINTFNGLDLVPRVVEVEFVEPSELRRRLSIGGYTEPLGVGHKE